MSTTIEPSRCYVGVDIGGTRMKFGLVDETGAVSCPENIPTPTDREGLYGAIDAYATARAAEGPIAGIGLSMPGIIDERGYTVTAGAVKALKNRPVQDELIELLGLPVRVTNDGRAATLAEGWVGAAQGVDNYVVFTLGTAIGAGIVIDGKLHQGLGGLAGEFGMSLAELAREDFEAHSFAQRAATVGGLCRQYSYAVHERVLDAQEIYRRAAAGDEVAMRCIDDFYQAVVILLVNTAVIVAPELIVLGGGISANEDAMANIAKRYQQSIDEHPVLAHVAMPRLVTAACRNEAGMIGAVRRLAL